MSDETEIKVDIGVLKTQVLTLSALCNKMDQVIEKLVDQHDRHIAKVYTDMDQRRKETDEDIGEIHERIDTVLDKVSDTEVRIMNEIKGLRDCMLKHNKEEKQQLDKLLQWKWMIVGGILVLSWLISHTNLDTIIKTIH
jgi:septal ring factor EnvC (AmiA/AmiB activator)